MQDIPDGAPHFVQYAAWPASEGSEWTTGFMTDDELVIANLAPDDKYAARIAEIVHGAQEPVYGAPVVSKYVEKVREVVRGDTHHGGKVARADTNHGEGKTPGGNARRPFFVRVAARPRLQSPRLCAAASKIFAPFAPLPLCVK